MDAVRSWVGFTLKPITHMDFRKRRFSKIQQHILAAIYACTIYNIWTCKNEAVWYAYARPPGRVLNMIQYEVR